MVKAWWSSNEWGTVCDDGFTQTSAQAACYTLGLRGGSFSYREIETDMVAGDSVDSDPMAIWMDNVECASGTSYFFNCPYRRSPPKSNCDGHWEDVVLFCS